uniref:Tyrosine-protein kinase receptor Tie-1 n=1 Tax=Magallana gigas TaxID=29159 RepID=K1R1V0_MAGGI
MFVIVSPLPNLTEKNMVCFLCPVIRLFWAAMADQIPPKADPRPIQRGSPYKNTERLRGYSLRVSNDTNVPPVESSCYNDTGIVTLPTIVEEDCERTTRYIWIHQTNKGNKDEWCPMLEICEVQVFGCDVGYYGENCSDRCYHCKNNATCGIQHGDCDDSGCVNPGKQPPRCKGCIIGMYGINCENNCSLYCAYGDCDRTTGTCLDGCKSGYIGRFCNKTCDDGEYGQNCQYMCTGNCINGEACDKASGHCRSCVEGYQGFKCDRDIRQSPTSSDTKKNDVDDLKMNKMILENEKTQKEIQKSEAEIEVLRVRKNSKELYTKDEIRGDITHLNNN